MAGSMEVLSEHQCQGWLEGYLLTGRHGLFNCYEAFIHIVDSMFNQHAKWLKVSAEVPWRRPIASLNYLLSSHVWRQDNNGFSHQDPGFIDHVVNKKAEIVRVYFPPDTNCLLSVADHCLRSKNYVNVIVAGKQPQLDWLTMDEALDHCTRGLGIWPFASNDEGSVPDVVMACCGDIPTLETLAAVELLRQHLPELKVRVVNVVDLMRLEPDTEHPHGLSDSEFDTIFTPDRPVIFAYHGYPTLIHRLTYRRRNHDNLHVRGYKEEGTTTTPFDMVMLNDLDRFHLVIDVLDRVPGLGPATATLRQQMVDARFDARAMGANTARIRPKSHNGSGQSRREMKILIAGSEAIGTVYGTQLAKHGHSVDVLAHGVRTEQIRRTGLLTADVISGVTDDVSVSVVSGDSEELDDLVLISVKVDQIDSVCANLRHISGAPDFLVFGNNPAGRRGLPDDLPGAIHLGFPGVGGELQGDRVAYMRIPGQPTTLEKGNGLISKSSRQY